MRINQDTDTIKCEIVSGKTIDLQWRLPALGLPNEEENKEKANELAMILYDMGYIHYFNELDRDSERLIRNGVTNRAFYLSVDDNCKLYISTNPATNNFEVKYVVYSRELNHENIQHIIYTLYAMGMLIPYMDANNSEKAS